MAQIAGQSGDAAAAGRDGVVAWARAYLLDVHSSGKVPGYLVLKTECIKVHGADAFEAAKAHVQAALQHAVEEDQGDAVAQAARLTQALRALDAAPDCPAPWVKSWDKEGKRVLYVHGETGKSST